MWRIGEGQDLVASMKGHKAAVTGLRLTRGDAAVASAGADGCCIIWDLRTFVRRASLARQLFSSVAYHPDESQLVTVGTVQGATTQVPPGLRGCVRLGDALQCTT